MTDLGKLLAQQFEPFSDDERDILKNFVQMDKDAKDFKHYKEGFLKILYKDLMNFYKWDVTHEDRTNIRKRLIRVSGLFFQVPIEELRSLSSKAKLSQKKIVYDSPPNPMEAENVEMHSYDLKYIEGFNQFFARVFIDVNLSALDYITGNREKRIYPHSQYIVFRKSIQEEVLSQTYLTASAEPLTQTQLISLYNPDGTRRDFITIGFDLIYESAFIDFFHHAPNLTPVTLSRNAHIMGYTFLEAALTRLSDLKKSGSSIEKEFPVYFLDPLHNNYSKIDSLMQFMADSLMPQIAEKIRQWNTQLSLDARNFDIYWHD
ncbi:hypothetical protein K1X76_10345 [bacterium]|nr:hypothetical protein [bacterium]